MPTAPVNLTLIVPTPTVATTLTQTPMVKSAAASIPVIVYNLAKGKFHGVPYPTKRPQAKQIPSVHNSNPPQLEAIPNAPTFQVREDTPWPNTELASTNLFQARADCPIPPTPAPTKTKVPPQIAVIPHTMVVPKQIGEKCTWGPHWPTCIKEEEEGMEDWNGDRQSGHPKNHHPQNAQHPQSYNVLDRYSEQIRLKREWDKKMEHLIEKYGLDYYSSLEIQF